MGTLCEELKSQSSSFQGYSLYDRTPVFQWACLKDLISKYYPPKQGSVYLLWLLFWMWCFPTEPQYKRQSSNKNSYHNEIRILFISLPPNQCLYPSAIHRFECSHQLDFKRYYWPEELASTLLQTQLFWRFECYIFPHK